MIEFFFKTEKDDYFLSIPNARENCWIYIEEATVDDLEQVCKITGLEYIDLQDSLDRYEIPRIERVDHHTLLFIRHPIELDIAVGLYTATLTIVTAGNHFITISPQKNPLIRSYLNKKSKVSTLERSNLIINLLIRITQEFTAQIRKVRHNVLTQEKEMINVESEDITSLTRHEEILNQYLSSLEPTGGVLKTMTRGSFAELYEKDDELIQDLLNAVKQSENLCTIAVKSIRSLRDSYNIIFTNNLHRTIKLLTSLTIIFNIPTMIASLYGMNIILPFAQRTHAFLIILAMIIAFSILALVIFRRKKWL